MDEQHTYEMDSMAEAFAQALDAVHRILERLVCEAHLTEDERLLCINDLALIKDNVYWADPEGKRFNAKPSSHP